MERSQNFKVRLGVFIAVGLTLFVLAIFIIGKQKNLFDPVIKISARFENVSGLQVGSSVRFSGINIGTVDAIRIVNDSTVKVDMLVKKEVQQFIKADSEAGIGSEGLIGDKLVVLSQGSVGAATVKDGQVIRAAEPIETDAILASLQITADNAALATGEINEILGKINSGKGTLGKLIQDPTMANNIDKTIVNLKNSTKGLDENMKAAQENFLLKGYFKRKAKAAEKAKKEAEKKKEKEAKAAAEAAEKAKEQSENEKEENKK
ncbi:MlaD family protein [Flavobacterium sp.]|uniref:MlaD family protein n=1 Tax=Flavobacterium sp. TaxID=239 RepID=UPI0039E217EF